MPVPRAFVTNSYKKTNQVKISLKIFNSIFSVNIFDLFVLIIFKNNISLSSKLSFPYISIFDIASLSLKYSPVINSFFKIFLWKISLFIPVVEISYSHSFCIAPSLSKKYKFVGQRHCLS